MKTFWNSKFKRDYECTCILAVKADELPADYDPAVWREDAKPAKPLGPSFMRLSIIHESGKSYEIYGYL